MFICNRCTLSDEIYVKNDSDNFCELCDCHEKKDSSEIILALTKEINSLRKKLEELDIQLQRN